MFPQLQCRMGSGGRRQILIDSCCQLGKYDRGNYVTQRTVLPDLAVLFRRNSTTFKFLPLEEVEKMGVAYLSNYSFQIFKNIDEISAEVVAHNL
jgi:hypothetical protein